jgi:hypothetical protein
MLRFLFSTGFFCLWASVATLGGTTGAEESYWQQYVHYTMNVKLDTATHTLTGQERILYRNQSPDTLRKIFLHLYPNAYRGRESVFAQESRKMYRNPIRKGGEGYIEIRKFQILRPDGTPWGTNPVAAYRVEDTILEADLPEPLLPGEEVVLELDFLLKVRKFSGRAGYRNRQYDFAQWYPKVCVYDENGWNRQPFHAVGEFYGEFGTFDVTITVPFSYIVGATGVVVRGDPGWEAVKVDTSLGAAEWLRKQDELFAALREQAKKTPWRTVTFHAENVHDFAWCTSSDFLYERGEYDGIPIHVLYRSYAKFGWSKKVAERGQRALEWLSEQFGHYPYPQLTIVHGLLGGGMEYPMLVMNSGPSESLILHEVGHIYFYGILGNNEWKEAWLDEGFTTFQTRWYMQTRYGDRKSYGFAFLLPRWLRKYYPPSSSHDAEISSIVSYILSGDNEPISRPSFRYRDSRSYSVNAYAKGSYFYEMLRYVVGEETFSKIVKTYFERWKFKHVNEERFKAVCEEVSGVDLSWFFDQWLHGTPVVDYALGGIKKSRKGKNRHRTLVEVVRKGDGIMPVELAAITASGDTLFRRVDGRARRTHVEWITDEPIRKVLLDPDDRILDVNRMNNGGLQIRFVPELTTMPYTLRNAYVVRWRPAAWYNYPDGANVGMWFRGSYMGRWRRVQVGVYYGLRSGAVDYELIFSEPLPGIGKQGRWGIRFAQLDGRRLGELAWTFTLARSTVLPPQFRFRLGFQAAELLDDRHTTLRQEIFDQDARGQKRTVYVPTWSPGKVTRLVLDFLVNPRGMTWQSEWELKFQWNSPQLGGDYDFYRIQARAVFRKNLLGLGWKIRTFGAVLPEDKEVPLQDLVYAYGASPFEAYSDHFARSRDALPDWLNYHVPGGGNLRGYFDHFAGYRKLIAMNVELQKSLRFGFRKPISEIQLALFGDAGHVWLPDRPGRTNRLGDLGFGIRVIRSGFFLPFTIRVDFPVYVTDPPAGQDRLHFRWILALSRAF